MDVKTKFPLTRLELAGIDGQAPVRFPATFDEYWELLSEAEYRADFYQNEIIAMSYATDLHSDLVGEMAFLLKKIFPKSDRRFKVHNSNRPVYVGDCDGHAVFNPDGSVVAQPPVYFEYQPGMNAETTPVVGFEVLSKNTCSYDFGTKLPCYKKIPSLQHIIFLALDKPSVILYTRQGPNSWSDTEYTQQEDLFYIQNHAIALKDIYLNVFFS